MSDGFDKEAEREKLREKFAEDEEQREHTQRMSELLLQGATMTNRHCDACGDPVFRHDGQEFCPTCHATEGGYAVPTDEKPASTEETTGAAAANGSPASAAPAVSSGNEHTTGSTDAGGNAEATPDPQRGATTGSEPTATTSDPDSTTTRRPEPTATTPDSASTAASDHRSGTNDPAASGLDDARASLTRTLTRFARAAEETDDPRRARDHLEAAREAAETLSALDR